MKNGYVKFIFVVLFFPLSIFASSDLDRKYALETIGTLKSWDNVDGIFSEYVGQAYKEYFQNQSRFIHMDISRSDELLSRATLPYKKLIEDKDVLTQVGKSMRVETLIRTRIYKEGPSYRFTLDWLLSNQAELLSTESFTLSEQDGMTKFSVPELKSALHKGLDKLIQKVPFLAHVTGRDREQITINRGRSAQLAPGDTVLIGTLEDVKIHPLLKQIVDWKTVLVGRAVVEDVDEGIGFLKIQDEEPGREISKYQKVMKIIPKPTPDVVLTTEEESHQKSAAQGLAYEKPKLGYLLGSVFFGSLRREVSNSSNSALGFEGSGLFLGAKGEAHIHLNRNFFAELGLGLGTSSYNQKNSSTQVQGNEDSFSISQTRLQFGVGFTHFLASGILGPQAWGKVGYRTASYGMPVSSNAQSGNLSIKSIFVGIGGSLPIRQEFGVDLNIDFGLFPSATPTGLVPGTVSGSSDVSFLLAGWLQFEPTLRFRIGFELVAQGAEFSNGTDISHRGLTVQPGVQFFF